ncbi:MAG: PEGA domain-containing protein [Polyangiaceae bacterium]
MMRPLATALLLMLTALVTGCYSSMQTVSLRVKGNVPDASVTIDDQYLGSLAFVTKRGVAMPPGKHRVTVEKPGYFPWDRLIEAQEAPVHLDIQLVPIPD